MRRTAHLLAGLAAFILIGWGAGALWMSVVGTSEADLMREIAAHRSQAATDLARTVTWAGSSFVLVPLALVSCALLVRAGLRAQALAVAVTLGGAMIISDVVKLLVARPRPAVVHLQAVTGFSFPSGHATQASAFWLSLVFAASTAGASAVRTSLLASGALVIVAARRSVTRLYRRALSERRDRRRPSGGRMGRLRRPVHQAGAPAENRCGRPVRGGRTQ